MGPLGHCGPSWAIVGRALVGPFAPVGPCVLVDLVGHALVGQALVAWALVGLHGLLWHPLAPCGPVPCGPPGPLWAPVLGIDPTGFTCKPQNGALLVRDIRRMEETRLPVVPPPQGFAYI